MADKEYMFKEIGLIEKIISRLASNSFMLKGWTVTLVVATLLLKGTKYQVLIAAIPLLMFWGLDAYFLRKERMYRELYKWVIANRLKSDEYLLDMKTERFKKDVSSLIMTMVSATIGCFYGSIVVLLIAYSIILFWK